VKRDWDLLRWILNEVESCEGGYPIVLTNGAMYSSAHYKLDIGERNFENVYEHILLLGDSGLAKVRDLGRAFNGPSGAVIDHLTMAGHDFLEAARNDTAWNKAKALAGKAGGTSVGVFKDILTSIIKNEIKKHTGLGF